MLPPFQPYSLVLRCVFFFCYFWRSFIFPVVITLKQSFVFRGRGISSSGRAPASHSGGTGTNTRIFQLFFGII